MKKCRCGKRKYDKLGSVIALSDIKAKDRPTAQERRSYHCPDDPTVWHLTKQPQRPRSPR